MKSALFIALLVLIVASKHLERHSTHGDGGGPKKCVKKNCGDQVAACKESDECTAQVNNCLSEVEEHGDPEEQQAKFQQCLSANELATALFDCVVTNCAQNGEQGLSYLNMA